MLLEAGPCGRSGSARSIRQRRGDCRRFSQGSARTFPDIRLHVSNGSTSQIIRQLECGKLNLGFIRIVENIGSLRFFSIAHERYLLAVPMGNPLATKHEVTIEDLKAEKIIAFKRQNLSFT